MPWPAGHKQRTRERIVEALTKTGGHRGKAAELLGCSRVTLWKNMRRYNL